MGWIEFRCDAHWSRWRSNNYITRCARKSVSWRSEFGVSCCSSRSENQVPAEAGPSGPLVEQPRRRRKKCCYSQKSWGSICCCFCSVSNSPLTHNPFVPFRIKCERYIFLKNCVRPSLLCWLCFCMFMSILQSSFSVRLNRKVPEFGSFFGFC